MQVKLFVQNSCLKAEVHVGSMLLSSKFCRFVTPILVCFIRYVNHQSDQGPEIDWKMSLMCAADVPGQKHGYINPLVLTLGVSILQCDARNTKQWVQ